MTLTFRFSRTIMLAATIGAATILNPFAAGAVESPAGSSEASTCTDNLVVIIPASAQTIPGIPEQIPQGGATTKLAHRLEGTPNTTVATVAYNSMWPTQTISYNNSVAAGIHAAENLITTHHQQCPTQKVHLFGYSEGADIAGAVASHIGAGGGPIGNELLGSAALMANPSRNTTVAQAGNAGNGKGIHPAYDYRDASHKVLEICNAGDAVCNADDVFPLLNANLTNPILDSSVFGGPWHPEVLPTVVENYPPRHWVQLPGEFTRMAAGWGIHVGSYGLPGGGLDAGETFIRDHLA